LYVGIMLCVPFISFYVCYDDNTGDKQSMAFTTI
jgi:hypothetical protein